MENYIIIDDGSDFLSNFITIIEKNPLYYLTVACILIYSVLLSMLVARDRVKIKGDPRVQFQLSVIKKEEIGFVKETKRLYQLKRLRTLRNRYYS